MSAERLRHPIVVLISGRGTNMRALIEDSRKPDSPYSVMAVFSDKREAAGLDKAAALGVPTLAVDSAETPDREEYDVHLACAIVPCTPSLIVLAGFMRILSPGFVRRFEGRIVNIHPSLLPLYPGLHTHRRVLAAGDRMHGATVHYVTAELDGGPRILQASLAVDPREDEAQLAARVQALEHRMYPLAVRMICDGRFRYVNGAAWFDSAPLNEPLQLADLDA